LYSGLTIMNIIPENQINFKKRLLAMLAAAAIQWIYVPASLRTSGGFMPKLPIDVFPVEPLWVIPYVLCFPLWVGGTLWAISKMDDRLFRALFNACIFTFSIGVTIFIFLPTYVIHPILPGIDVWTLALKYIYVVGGSYAALPSGHIYMTTLLALFFSRWYPGQWLLWLLVFLTVVFSTLFTGQHYLLDVVAGAMLGWLGYHFGLWRAGLVQSSK